MSLKLNLQSIFGKKVDSDQTSANVDENKEVNKKLDDVKNKISDETKVSEENIFAIDSNEQNKRKKDLIKSLKDVDISDLKSSKFDNTELKDIINDYDEEIIDNKGMIDESIHSVKDDDKDGIDGEDGIDGKDGIDPYDDPVLMQKKALEEMRAQQCEASRKYNNDGLLISEDIYIDDVKYHVNYSYKDGQISLKSISNSQGILIEQSEYKYDDKGRLSEESTYKPNNRVVNNRKLYKTDTTKYEYDDKGKLLSSSKGKYDFFSDNPSKIIGYEDCKYNDDGLCTTKLTFADDHYTIQSSVDTTYDDNGEVLHIQEFKYRGDDISYLHVIDNNNGYFEREEKYNENNVLIYESETSKKGLYGTSHTVKTYDDSGRILTEKVQSLGIDTNVEYVYNDNDSIKEKITKNEDGSIRQKSLYTYNDDGSVAKEETYKLSEKPWNKGELIKSSESAFEYYDDGRIKTENIIEYRLKASSFIGTFLPDSLKGDVINKQKDVNYDRNGNITSSVTYDSKHQKVLDDYEAKYNSKGEIIYSKDRSFENDQVVSQKEMKVVNGNKEYSSSEYNSTGVLLYEGHYVLDKDNKFISKYENYYDDNGNLTFEFQYEPDDYGFYKEVYKPDYDGYIDYTRQGGYGDCWLLSGLTSLSYTDRGKEIIQNAVTRNPDNSFDVYFKGIDTTIKITEEEIKDARESMEYSKGDNDMLVMELAFESALNKIQNGEITIKGKHPGLTVENRDEDDRISIDGGRLEDVVFMLTGEDVSSLDNKISIGLLINYIEEKGTGKIATQAAFGFGNGGAGAKIKDINGETMFTVPDDPSDGHAFAIKRADKDTVTLVNPWDSSKEWVLDKDTFNKYICYVEVCNLLNIN